MGYQALVFCPDEKTARTVTQVLTELEFAVEACTEPFAAVKKLMGQHFDAIVVDCDNEQNATLLFKSARNSSSNQTSLAVAVVEGQAGVAKAFRIGANLVLTKPINIEQAKGTVRVARGLLRKSEPGKTGTPSTGPGRIKCTGHNACQARSVEASRGGETSGPVCPAASYKTRGGGSSCSKTGSPTGVACGASCSFCTSSHIHTGRERHRSSRNRITRNSYARIAAGDSRQASFRGSTVRHEFRRSQRSGSGADTRRSKQARGDRLECRRKACGTLTE